MAWWSRRGSEESGNDGNDSGREHPAYPMSIEVFEDWLAGLEPATEAFIDFGLPEQHTAEPFTRDSLAQLGPFIRWMWPDVDAVYADQRQGLDGMVRYIGETFRRHFGGEWTYSTSPNADVRGRPYLVLGQGLGTLDPFACILGTVDEGGNDYLTFIFDLSQQNADPESDEPSGAMRADEDFPTGLSDFLISLDATIEAWANGPAAPAERWDFSTDSFRALGELLLAQPRPDGDLTEHPLTGGALRYIGETMRRAHGGEWTRKPGERGGTNPFAGQYVVRRLDADGDPVDLIPEFAIDDVYDVQDPNAIAEVTSEQYT